MVITLTYYCFAVIISFFGLRYHLPEEFSHDAEPALVQMQEVYLKSTFDKVFHLLLFLWFAFA